ncbi:MAG: alanine--glyoxylate aminotransferase family protein [Gammaproteobacteria bacterium]|nr:alanine--glyoxylate aminotransferase family protein [Gammaproteobacteria bacterium]
MNIQSFTPPNRILMGPGPSNIHPRVLKAMGAPIIGHLDPVFIDMMDELKSLLQYAFQTRNALTMPISGPGSAGMEACFVNLVQPDDKVVVCRNGVFGSRMLENVTRTRGRPVVVDDTWGEPVDPQKLDDALKANPDAQLVAFVHAETSTGACSDVATLVEIAHRHGCLAIVDSVTALGGSPLKVDEWGVDAIYSGTQKCLSCVPGLAPLSFNEAAVERLKKRSEPVQSWFLDLNLLVGYWAAGAKRAYHHTAPINSLYALHEALVMLREEGLENAWARHRHHHLALKAGLETLGIRFVVDAAYRLPQLNAVYVPDGVDEALVRQRLLNEFNLEIGAGLGALAGKAWRIGLMGHTCSKDNVLLCLRALNSILSDVGLGIQSGAAEAAARTYYRQTNGN